MSIVTETSYDYGVPQVVRTLNIRKTDNDLIELSSFDGAPFGVSVVGAEDDYTLDEAARFAKDLSDAIYEGRKLNGYYEEQDAVLRKYDEAQVAASATACGIDGCDGEMHDPNAEASAWPHRVASIGFDDGAVTAEIIYEASRGFFAYVSLAADAEMTPAELHADVALYANYPAWLRSVADRVDALNAASVN